MNYSKESKVYCTLHEALVSKVQDGAGQGRAGQVSRPCRRAMQGKARQADLWPVKECVQKPPSMSHTLADLSALAVASRPPLPSTAM